MPAARIQVPRFVGPSNRLLASAASNEATINWYPETTRGGGKVERYLRPAEGIRPHAQLTSADSSAMFSEDGRAYVACGTVFAEFLDGGTSIPLGTIAYDPLRPATICSNGEAGKQIMIVSGFPGQVYIYATDTGVFTHVDFGELDIKMCEFMDGYFFALLADSRDVFYSALENGLVWDFTFGEFERNWGADNIQFIKRMGRGLWLVGSKTSEVWADTGNANSPFAPIQGVFMDIGCVAAATGQRDGQSLTWVSQDERGAGLVVRANGYRADEISTYAIDLMIQQRGSESPPLPRLTFAEGMVHQILGHTFYWLHLDWLTQETTPVFDFGEGEWSERAMWDAVHGIFTPHIARCHCYAFERHFIGTRTNGIIYELSPSFLENRIAA